MSRGTGFPADVCDLIEGRSGGYCEVCGLALMWDRHHRRPRASGGSKRSTTHTAANGLAVCRDCHNLIESYRNVASMLGWLVPQAVSNPCAVPVLYRGQWRLLDNEGHTYRIPEPAGGVAS